MLNKIYIALSRCPPSHDRAMLWAACTACFFGFFRAGETTIPTKTAFTQAQHMTWKDVRVDNKLCPSVLRIHLKISKCDQFGKGVDVFVGRVDNHLCLVGACQSYMAHRGPVGGPFFHFEDGSPITKGLFIKKCKEVIAGARIGS